MGLDISHDTWHGAYSAFMTWRKKIAQVAGYPPLELMEGYYSNESEFHNPFSLLERAFPDGDELAMSALREYKKEFPIKWDNFKKDPLIELLTHSDCDGKINWKNCKGIADRLEELLPLLPDGEAGGHIGHWRRKTEAFIKGLRLAYSKKEKLDFH
jgi:hypothetical protein